MSAHLTSEHRHMLRSLLLEARCELLRTWREPAFTIPVLLFPALFYLLFGVLMKGSGDATIATYLLVNYGVFGVICVAMFGFGVALAVDRDRGVLRLRQVQPVLPGAMLAARSAMVLLFALLVLLQLAALAVLFAGVRLAAGQWLGLFAMAPAGTLPFAAMGLYLGTRFSGNAAPAVINAIFLPMAFLSGLWLPLAMLPDWLARLAPIWPAYHLSQLALKLVDADRGSAVLLHLGVLAVFTLGFYMLAQRRLGAPT